MFLLSSTKDLSWNATYLSQSSFEQTFLTRLNGTDALQSGVGHRRSRQEGPRETALAMNPDGRKIKIMNHKGCTRQLINKMMMMMQG